jgi:hypothetical protein
MRKIVWLAIIILMLGITACSSPSATTQATDIPAAMATISIPPTPDLEPAENYADGTSDIPAGMIVFVELYTSSDCSWQCQCPVVEPPRQIYEWSSPGNLCTLDEYLYNSYFLTSTSTISPTAIAGLFGYGRWHEKLSAINAFPYEEYYIPIYGANADGSIVVGLQGKKYFLKPGQSWTDSGTYKDEPPAGCSKSYMDRLTNYGFVKREDIRLGCR